MIFEPVDLLEKVEISFDCSLADRELRRKLSNLVKIKLTSNFLCNLWHHFEVVKFAKTAEDLTDVKAVVECVLRVVVFFKESHQ